VRVIFLDIDGVLNCSKTPNPHKLPYVVDKRLLRIFNRIVRSTRAKIVLISDWRRDPAGLFSAKHWGVRYLDVVPYLPKRSRGEQILLWLKRHPKVKRYAVLDDDDDDLDNLPLFQPSATRGLNSKIANGIIKYLCGRTDQDMRYGPLIRTWENVRKELKRVI
jgi:hypothetical protein